MARPEARGSSDVRSRSYSLRPHRDAPDSPVMLLFASDIHLSSHRPDAVTAFAEFLAGPVRRADRLYLLGDVFDLWLGDDDDRAPHPEVEAALAKTVSAGVPVDLIRGNHDFLLGSAFAERTGCRLVEEPHVIETMDERAVLLHGDTLCTRDVEYQAFRRYARDAGNQRAFLARPIEERAREAAKIRATSNSRTRLKPEDIMDVTEDEVGAGALGLRCDPDDPRAHAPPRCPRASPRDRLRHSHRARRLVRAGNGAGVGRGRLPPRVTGKSFGLNGR